jgi:hypothetical protein
MNLYTRFSIYETQKSQKMVIHRPSELQQAIYENWKTKHQVVVENENKKEEKGDEDVLEDENEVEEDESQVEEHEGNP